jgi:hypothetical protein
MGHRPDVLTPRASRVTPPVYCETEHLASDSDLVGGEPLSAPSAFNGSTTCKTEFRVRTEGREGREECTNTDPDRAASLDYLWIFSDLRVLRDLMFKTFSSMLEVSPDGSRGRARFGQRADSSTPVRPMARHARPREEAAHLSLGPPAALTADSQVKPRFLGRVMRQRPRVPIPPLGSRSTAQLIVKWSA